MRVTAGARFIAAERLKGRDRRSALLIALASSLVLSFTIVPYLFHPSTFVQSGLTALSFLASLLTISFSLIQYSTNDAANAEQFHRCALEINELYRLNEGIASYMTLADVRSLAVSYNTVLQKYSVNHDQADHNAYRVSRPDQYRVGDFERIKIAVARMFAVSLPYLLLTTIPLGLAAILYVDARQSAPKPKPAIAVPTKAPQHQKEKRNVRAGRNR